VTSNPDDAATQSTTTSAGFLTKPVLAGVVGNIMEWYDFALFGYFAAILGALYFPSGDPSAELIKTYGVFAASFVMRPVGAVVFGHLGDRLGRKRALELSVGVMAIPTFLLGLLPTYAQVGIAASIALTLLRLLQGVSVGGEYTSSFSFVIEHAPADRRGLHGALTTTGAIVGILLGSLVSALTLQTLTPQQAQSWGFRVPFLFGVVVGGVGLYIRSQLHETPSYERMKAEGNIARSPIREALANNPRQIFATMTMYWLGAAGFYVIFFNLVAYLPQVVGTPREEAQLLNSIALLVLIVTLPTAAYVSDRIGRRPVLLVGCTAMFFAVVPLFWLLNRGGFGNLLVAHIALAILCGLAMAPIPAAVTELFPARTRFSGLSIGYNASLALFGGTSPMISTYLVKLTGDTIAPAYYLAFAALMSFITVLVSPETYRKPLDTPT